MAAAATDKFRKLARRWVGQIGAGGVNDDTTTTIPLSSATNLPTDTGVTVVIDRVDANGDDTPLLEETVTGVVSGTNLVNCVRGVEGTAQAHGAGAVVEVLFSNAVWSDTMTGILTEHTQAGVHKMTQVVDTNGNEVVKLGSTASAVNEVTITNAATGNGPTISATGGDDNINLNLTPKGTGDVNLPTGVNILVNSANPKRAMYIPASAMISTITSGAAAGQYETSSVKLNFRTFDFDTATQEAVNFQIPAPLNWDLSTITAQFFWTAASGSGTVAWTLYANALSDDDAMDASLGTPQSATDTLITANDLHITAATSAITVAGTPAANDMIHFVLVRSVGSDTLNADARLIGVRIEYGISKYNDIA